MLSQKKRERTYSASAVDKVVLILDDFHNIGIFPIVIMYPPNDP
jgi:hypothetical protein